MKNLKQKNLGVNWCDLKPLGFKEDSSFQIPRSKSAGFLFSILLLLLLSVIPANLLKASEVMVSSDASGKSIGERKNLRGTVGATNHEGMAFIIKKDEAQKSESEMWLPFGSKPRLSGYNSTAEIQEGDEAVVTYEENAEGTSRVLREVNFVQRNPPAPQPAEEEEENEEQPE